MVLSSQKRILISVMLVVWTGCQIAFFLPAPKKDFVILPSRAGNFLIFQNGQSAVLIGIYSDRRRRIVKKELIPFLKKAGVREIETLVLTGFHASEMGALSELQKVFRIKTLIYPENSALNLRRMFQSAGKAVVQFKRLESHLYLKEAGITVETLIQDAEGALLKVCLEQRCMFYLSGWSVAVPPADFLKGPFLAPVIFPQLRAGMMSAEASRWMRLFKAGVPD